MGRIVGLLVIAAVALATIYAYNKLSGSNVSALGAKTATA